MCLPDFTEDGLLPPGTYQLTIPEVKKSHLVTGTSSRYRDWDSLWRSELVNNAEVLIYHLWKAGIQEIFFDGSFVEDKSRPGDIDGYYNCTFLQYDELSEQNTIWDMTQRVRFNGDLKPLMWANHRVELYPHYTDKPYYTGILDDSGNDLKFPSAFRRTREHQEKGIIQVIKE